MATSKSSSVATGLRRRYAAGLRSALLSFLFVLLRGQRGLFGLSDEDLRFVQVRAWVVGLVPCFALVCFALLSSGRVATYALMAAGVWWILFLKQVAAVIKLEKLRRSKARRNC